MLVLQANVSSGTADGVDKLKIIGYEVNVS